ncbi:hypothetical protein B0T10DRAFT_79905 [Thelonectria olida]|uniref:Uncharacterized protein n=1 Tax=Thelonectria olida TaxID=1576542 RepID=A0A9P9AMG6_9HYPO|nr:hypothetical protein B0T10DRAFT_79905 [Thelonectria olida]
MSTTSTRTQLQVAMSPQAETEAEDTRQLSFELLIKHNDKRDALKLVADSVAQQRQVASSALIFHPICLSALIGFISLVQMNVDYIRTDYSAMMVTYSGVVMGYLMAVRYVTSKFIRIAEETEWPNWLKNEDGADDVVIGARFGPEMIAAVVLRRPRTTPRSKATHDSKATIRAWTTKTKYRCRGLGGDMLREAVKKTKETLGPNGVVEIAEDHANSNLLPLPASFNAVFTRREQKAKDALSAAMRDWETAEH